MAAALGIPFVETSAKSDYNIKETIKILSSELSKKIVNEMDFEK